MHPISGWNHPFVVLLSALVQFLGVFLVFLIFTVYLIPFVEERFETRLPAELISVAAPVVWLSP